MSDVVCDVCRAPIVAPAQPHRFFDVHDRPAGTYCDAHCPRCWSGRREVQAS